MSWFRLLPLAWRLGLTVAALVGVIGGGSAVYFGWRHHQRMIGWNGALAKVAEQDLHARAIATKAAQDVDTCERNGGSFDVSTGDCSK